MSRKNVDPSSPVSRGYAYRIADDDGGDDDGRDGWALVASLFAGIVVSAIGMKWWFSRKVAVEQKNQ